MNWQRSRHIGEESFHAGHLLILPTALILEHVESGKGLAASQSLASQN